jgi:hypothetical protein
MEQLVQAIQSKYNLSSDEATKVVQTLVQVEQKRQAETGAGSSPAGMRGIGASRGMGSDIMGLLGGLMNESGQQSNQGGIGGDLMGMLGGMMGGSGNQQQSGGGLGGLVGDLLGGGGNQQQGAGGELIGILGGLLGGSGQQGGQGNIDMGSLVGSLLGGNHNMGSSGNTLGAVLDLLSDGGQQNHANSLENIVGGLLGSSGGQGNMDISGLVGNLLGGSGGSSPSQSPYNPPFPPQPPPQQQQQQPTKPDMGSIQDAIGNLAVGNPKKKDSFKKQ